MLSNVRNECRLGDNRLCKLQLKFFKIFLYDIKNVVLQRRITYIRHKMCAMNSSISV